MRLKILLIENDLSFRANLKQVLEKYNYEVITTNSGLDGLKIIYREKPTCIVMNVQTPLLNGLELINATRDIDDIKFRPFIFITSPDQLNFTRKCMNAGGDDFLVKPFSGEDLVKSVISRCQKLKQIQEYANNVKSNIFRYFPYELRESLFIMMSYMELICNSIEHIKPDQIEDFKKTIQLSTMKVTDITNKFLNILHLEFDQDLLTNGKDDFCQINNNIISNIVSKLNFNILVKNNFENEFLSFSNSLLTLLLNELFKFSYSSSDKNKIIQLIGKSKNDYYEISIRYYEEVYKNKRHSKLDLFDPFNYNKQRQINLGFGFLLIKKIVKTIKGEINFEDSDTDCSVIKITVPIFKKNFHLDDLLFDKK